MPNSFTAEYSGAEPSLNGATVSGLKGEDHLDEGTDYTLSKEEGVDVREQAYEISSSLTSNRSDIKNNYNIKCKSGWVNITKKDATISFEDKDGKDFIQTYGDPENHIIATTSDFVEGDVLTENDYKIILIPGPSAKPSNSDNKPVGKYNIGCDITNIKHSNNYHILIDEESSKYEIVKRNASLTALDKTSVYGQSEATLEIIQENIKDDITPGIDYFIFVDYNGQTKINKDAGIYAIKIDASSPAGVLLKNYNLSLSEGKYTITRLEINSIKPKDLEKTYGDYPEFTYETSTPLVEGETLSENDDYDID